MTKVKEKMDKLFTIVKGNKAELEDALVAKLKAKTMCHDNVRSLANTLKTRKGHLSVVNKSKQ